MNQRVFHAFADELTKIALAPVGLLQKSYMAAKNLKGPLGDALRKAQAAGHAVPEFGVPTARQAFKAAPKAVGKATKAMKKAPAPARGGDTAMLSAGTAAVDPSAMAATAKKMQAATEAMKGTTKAAPKAARKSWSMDVSAMRGLPRSATLAKVTKNPSAYGAKVAALIKAAAAMRQQHAS